MKVQARSLNLPRFHDLTAELGEDPVEDVAAVLPAAAGDDFYRITLTGTGAVDLEVLQQEFADYPNLLFRDQTEPPPNMIST